MQIQADLLGVQIFRPDMVELTALGAAKLAAKGIGLPRTDRTGETARVRIFNPTLAPAAREEMLAKWHVAVGKA
jgi:glycerol kinase